MFKLDTKNPEMYKDVTTLLHNGNNIGQVSIKVEKQTVTESGRVITRRVNKRDDELLITLQN